MRHFSRFMVLVAFAALVLSVACRTSDPENVATVNGQVITRADFEVKVAELINQMRMDGRLTGMQVTTDVMNQIRSEVLDRMITEVLLLQACSAASIEVDEAAVDNQMGNLVVQYGEEGFDLFLQEQGITREILRQEFVSTNRISRLLNATAYVGIEVTPEDALSFYTERQDSFAEAEQVRASHILITAEDDDTEVDRAAKLAEIRGYQQQIAAGADFAEMARAHSNCPSAPSGGDLGYFDRSAMVGAFADAAFSTPVGSVSDVVETEFGYHLILVTDHKPARVIPFEEVEEQLTAYLLNSLKQDALENYIAELENAADIVLFVDYAPAAEAQDPAATSSSSNSLLASPQS